MAVAKLRRGFELVLEVVAVFLLVLLAVIVLLGVGYRVSGNPLPWYDEVASVLLAWLTYYGAALGALKRAHISFPGLVRALKPAWRVPLVVFGEACVLGFFILLAWYGWLVLELLAGDTLISAPIPVELTQSVIPIGAALFVIAELLMLPQILASARGDGSQDHDALAAEVQS